MTASRPTAVVVGSGPNGLAAAVTLAQGGVRVTVLEAADTIGGGTRSAELTVPGLVHDVCSAVHPLGVGSPYLRSLPLAEHGLEWCWPEMDLAHPLDDGSAGVQVRSIQETARGLGADGAAWRRVFGGPASGFDQLAGDLLGPILRWPDHPVRLAGFGPRALAPATVLARAFRTPRARALWAGSAAHAMGPLTAPGSSAPGLMLVAAGHRHGWPVARGGSAAISTALASLLVSLGGEVVTGQRVETAADLPAADLTLLDTSPRAAAGILGDRLPRRTARAYRRFRSGSAAFKVDLAVRDGVPWTAEAARRAGTVHVGGTLEQVVAAEADVAAGRMPAQPFVLVAQQYLADPGRSVTDAQGPIDPAPIHPIWAYAHVPAGYAKDATDAVLDQIERFAPGLRDRIVATAVRTPADLEADNPNDLGGDIGGGANDLSQLIARPRLAVDPYATGVPGTFLCSASTPPGGGVHGMCGHQAAVRALRRLGTLATT